MKQEIIQFTECADKNEIKFRTKKRICEKTICCFSCDEQCTGSCEKPTAYFGEEQTVETVDCEPLKKAMALPENYKIKKRGILRRGDLVWNPKTKKWVSPEKEYYGRDLELFYGVAKRNLQRRI